MDGRMDSPTFRTNWSHEILGEPKKDRAAFLRKEDGEASDVANSERKDWGFDWLREEEKVSGRILRWVYTDQPTDIPH